MSNPTTYPASNDKSSLSCIVLWLCLPVSAYETQYELWVFSQVSSCWKVMRVLKNYDFLAWGLVFYKDEWWQEGKAITNESNIQLLENTVREEMTLNIGHHGMELLRKYLNRPSKRCTANRIRGLLLQAHSLLKQTLVTESYLLPILLGMIFSGNQQAQQNNTCMNLVQTLLKN